jgi:hypothetical protein
MNTSMMVDFAPQAPMHLYGTETRTAQKFGAACENARKAYLRTLYGFQPDEGGFHGYVRYAKATGAVVAVEIHFYFCSPAVGVFEVPIHVFKQDGKTIVSSDDVENFVNREVGVIVSERYKFNGISLSNVIAIELDSTTAAVVYDCSEAAQK